MTVLTYPSPLVPAPPRVRLEVPDDWTALGVADTLLAARETGRPDGDFATNVTVRHLVRPAEVTEQTLLEELRGVLAAKEQGELGEPFARQVNGTPVRGVLTSYVDPAAGTLAQVHVFARTVPGHRASIVQLTASFRGSLAAELGPVVDRVVNSLQIAWPDREPPA